MPLISGVPLGSPSSGSPLSGVPLAAPASAPSATLSPEEAIALAAAVAAQAQLEAGMEDAGGEAEMTGTAQLIPRTYSTSVGGRGQWVAGTATGPWAVTIKDNPTYRDITVAGAMVTQAVFSGTIDLDSAASPNDYIQLSDGPFTGMKFEILDTNAGATDIAKLGFKSVRLR